MKIESNISESYKKLREELNNFDLSTLNLVPGDEDEMEEILKNTPPLDIPDWVRNDPNKKIVFYGSRVSEDDPTTVIAEYDIVDVRDQEENDLD